MRRNPSGHRERRGKQSKEKVQGRYRSKRPCSIGQPALTYRCIKDGHRRDDADCRHAHTQDASAKEDDQRHPSRELTLPEQGHRRPHHGRQRGDKHHLRVPTEDPQGKHDATKRWRERVPVNRARDHPQQGGEQPVRPRLVQQRGTTYNKEGLTEDQAGKGGLDAGCAPRPGKAIRSHTRQRRRKCNRTVVASLRTTDEQGNPDQGRKPSVLTERDRKAPRYRRRPKRDIATSQGIREDCMRRTVREDHIGVGEFIAKDESAIDEERQKEKQPRTERHDVRNGLELLLL